MSAVVIAASTTFAAGERVIDEGLFSAIVIMVIVTTMATPPALKWSLSRAERAASSRPTSERA